MLFIVFFAIIRGFCFRFFAPLYLFSIQWISSFFDFLIQKSHHFVELHYLHFLYIFSCMILRLHLRKLLLIILTIIPSIKIRSTLIPTLHSLIWKLTTALSSTIICIMVRAFRRGRQASIHIFVVMGVYMGIASVVDGVVVVWGGGVVLVAAVGDGRVFWVGWSGGGSGEGRKGRLRIESMMIDDHHDASNMAPQNSRPKADPKPALLRRTSLISRHHSRPSMPRRMSNYTIRIITRTRSMTLRILRRIRTTWTTGVETAPNFVVEIKSVNSKIGQK